MTVPAIAPIGDVTATPLALQLGGATLAQPAPSASFGDLLVNGLHTMDTKVANADQLVRQFALGDDIPVHQVTMALEQARLSVELTMQVRARLIESYRELMNMQL
jgi:flagellar hook-basal body complex protein FliE